MPSRAANGAASCQTRSTVASIYLFSGPKTKKAGKAHFEYDPLKCKFFLT
jgi:hypothetical protein